MFIDVNGTTLFYEKSGRGSPIILLHCNYSTHKIFDVLTKELEPEHTVFAIDSRGHGKSKKWPYYDYYTMAEDIAEFIKQLKIEKPIIYGYSDGGILALIIASKHPGLVSGIISSGANLDISGQTPSALRTVKFGYFITRDKRLRLILDQPDIPFDMLKNITVPALILAGSKDMIREEHTRKIAQHIAGGELKIIDGEGHGTYIAHSKKLYPIINPFIKKTLLNGKVQ